MYPYCTKLRYLCACWHINKALAKTGGERKSDIHYLVLTIYQVEVHTYIGVYEHAQRTWLKCFFSYPSSEKKKEKKRKNNWCKMLAIVFPPTLPISPQPGPAPQDWLLYIIDGWYLSGTIHKNGIMLLPCCPHRPQPQITSSLPTPCPSSLSGLFPMAINLPSSSRQGERLTLYPSGAPKDCFFLKKKKNSLKKMTSSYNRPGAQVRKGIRTMSTAVESA